jgi:RNA polymerase sigma-70 factor, ECF subfamily
VLPLFPCEAPPPDDEESSWIRDTLAGRVAAFSHLYARYYGVVARRLTHLMGPAGAVDDLVQDTFVRAMNGLPQFRHQSPFRHWLLRIATSVARDEQRRVRRSIWRLFLEPDEINDTPAPAPGDAYADLTAVHRALQRLSPRLREVVILFELEGQTLAEIAAELEISLHTAGSRLRRGREKLRRALIKGGYAELAELPSALCIEDRA